MKLIDKRSSSQISLYSPNGNILTADQLPEERPDAREAADRKAAKTPDLNEIAVIRKDINIFTGWLQKLENPDPVIRTEGQALGLRLYDEVERDPHAGGVLDTRCLGVVSCDWEIVPGKSGMEKGNAVTTDLDQEIADFVTETLKDTNFNQIKKELMQAVLYGYYCAEVIWKKTEKGIQIKKFHGHHPRQFVFDAFRVMRLITWANMVTGEDIPERKFMNFSWGDSNNPYGKGLGQRLWWYVWFKKNGIKFWLNFLEKFASPTVVGKYPPNSAETAKLEEAVEAFISESGITIPDNMKIELVEATRAGNAQYEGICHYFDSQISIALLGQTLTTEMGKEGGSFAASKTHGEVKQEIKEADADLLDDCLSNGLIKWLVDYNFPGVKSYPTHKTHAEAKPNLKEQSEIDETLVCKIGLRIGAKYFYQKYNIPEPGADEECVGGIPLKTPEKGPAFAEAIKYLNFAQKARRRLNEGQDEIEYLIDQLNDSSSPAMTKMIGQIKKLVDESTDLQEVAEKLLEIYPDMNDYTLASLMQQAMTVANLNGRIEREGADA